MELVKNIYWVGVRSDENQTSSNAYLIKTKKTYILVDTVMKACWDQFQEIITEVTAIEHIKYLIISHSGEVPIGCVEELLKMNPSIKIVASKAAYYYLRTFLDESVIIIGVGDYDVLHIDDMQVTFLMTPNLCRPDTMLTYIDKHHLLFSCDVFSSSMVNTTLMCSNNPFKEQYNEGITQDLATKFNGLKYELMKSLDKLKHYPIKMIAPGHGFIIDETVENVLLNYENFCFPSVESD